MLELNPNLTWLNIAHNSIREKGACAVAAALAVNTRLTHLDVAWNSFGKGRTSEGASASEVALAQSLETNQTLVHLDLAHNGLSEGGAMCLSPSLFRNRVLLHLNLDGNPLGKEGGRALLHVFSQVSDADAPDFNAT